MVGWTDFLENYMRDTLNINLEYQRIKFKL